jgi:hypothetical protein
MPKLHYYHDGLVKKPSQKDPVKMVVQIDLSKMAFWSSWTWGQENHLRGF